MQALIPFWSYALAAAMFIALLIWRVGAGATGNVVQGNFIGTNVTGTAALLTATSAAGVGRFVHVSSLAARDRCMAKVMKDPRLAKMMDPKKMPFDGKRMFWGGFETIHDTAKQSAPQAAAPVSQPA